MSPILNTKQFSVKERTTLLSPQKYGFIDCQIHKCKRVNVHELKCTNIQQKEEEQLTGMSLNFMHEWKFNPIVCNSSRKYPTPTNSPTH